MKHIKFFWKPALTIGNILWTENETERDQYVDIHNDIQPRQLIQWSFRVLMNWEYINLT
jgi:hypothetical protein